MTKEELRTIALRIYGTVRFCNGDHKTALEAVIDFLLGHVALVDASKDARIGSVEQEGEG